MKNALTIIAGIALATFPTTDAQSLTKSQREQLHKQLQRLLEQTTEADKRKRSSAYSAYRNAMGSGAAALDLYLKCVEKVDFTDMGKSSSDFREWRRKNEEQLGDSGFRLALRYQLRWLVLTIEASKRGEAEYSTLGSEAREIMTSILANADDLEEHRKVLSQNVVQSHFARAYSFNKLEVKKWPTSPTNFQALYKSVILPPLIEKKKYSEVRSAWMEMIRFEEKRMEVWSEQKRGKIGMKKNMGSAALNKWRAETYPQLLWSMEQDVLKAGGEYSALSKMVTHLSKYLDHPSALDWANELNGLLAPEDSGEAIAEIPQSEPQAPVTQKAEAPAQKTQGSTPSTKPKEGVIKKSGYIELDL